MYSFSAGLGQTGAPPSQCVQTFLITQDDEIYIEPGVVNCFSCALENVAWLVEEGGDLVPPSLSPNAEAVGSFLVIAMPDNYVTPGTAGRQEIVCIRLTESDVQGQNFEVRLASPSRWE